jgi:hypothetical protein
VWLDLHRFADGPAAARASSDVAVVRDWTGKPGEPLVLALGGLRTISGYRIKHAGYEGSPAPTALNTRDFTVEVAQRARGPWRAVDVVTGNTENLTDRRFDLPVPARYVRLSVQRPAQSDDTTARVLEFAALADAEGLPDLARYRPAVADAANSTAHHVTDPAEGLWENTSGHAITWLSVDLGADRTVGRYVVEHAGVPDLNTRDFLLQSSDNDKQWTTRDSVTANTSATTDRTVRPFTARYVRLVVTRPVADSVPEKTTRLRTLSVHPPV